MKIRRITCISNASYGFPKVHFLSFHRLHYNIFQRAGYPRAKEQGLPHGGTLVPCFNSKLHIISDCAVHRVHDPNTVAAKIKIVCVRMFTWIPSTVSQKKLESKAPFVSLAPAAVHHMTKLIQKRIPPFPCVPNRSKRNLTLETLGDRTDQNLGKKATKNERTTGNVMDHIPLRVLRDASEINPSCWVRSVRSTQLRKGDGPGRG